MIRILLIIFTLGLTSEANALLCNKTCGTGGNCAHLSYFLNNCAHCNKIQAKCTANFCANNPNLCEAGAPLQNLSINTHDVISEDKVLDVCIAKLFPKMIFNDHANTLLTISGLNGMDISFFSQTTGDPGRNLGMLRSLIASYLVYLHPDLAKNEKLLGTRVDQYVTVEFLRDINNLSLEDYHIISENVRREIYKLKGIDSQLRVENYKGKKYPMTVSKLGCPGETSPTPIGTRFQQSGPNTH